MAAEQRYIILSDNEFTLSLQSFRRTHQGVLPDGDIVNWAVGDKGTVSITINSEDEQGTKQTVFALTPGRVINILTRFCVENNIPIPRESTKRWTMRKAGIALSISLESITLEGISTAEATFI